MNHHFKVVAIYMVGLKGNRLLKVSSRETNSWFKHVLLPVRSFENSNQWKKSIWKLVNSKRRYNILSGYSKTQCFLGDQVNNVSVWLAICQIHQIWHLWVTIYLGFYKILLKKVNCTGILQKFMEKSSLLRKLQDSERIEL